MKITAIPCWVALCLVSFSANALEISFTRQWGCPPLELGAPSPSSIMSAERILNWTTGSSKSCDKASLGYDAFLSLGDDPARSVDRARALESVLDALMEAHDYSQIVTYGVAFLTRRETDLSTDEMRPIRLKILRAIEAFAVYLGPDGDPSPAELGLNLGRGLISSQWTNIEEFLTDYDDEASQLEGKRIRTRLIEIKLEHELRIIRIHLKNGRSFAAITRAEQLNDKRVLSVLMDSPAFPEVIYLQIQGIEDYAKQVMIPNTWLNRQQGTHVFDQIVRGRLKVQISDDQELNRTAISKQFREKAQLLREVLERDFSASPWTVKARKS